MKKTEQIVDVLAALTEVNRVHIEKIVEMRLVESGRTPYGICFKGRAEEDGVEIDFRESLLHNEWLFALRYDIKKARDFSSIKCEKYGTMVSMDMNADIPPEGVVSEVYYYNNLRLSFSYTSRSKKLYSMVLRKDKVATPDRS